MILFKNTILLVCSQIAWTCIEIKKEISSTFDAHLRHHMLTDINPKLPMRDKAVTRDFYLNKLNFREFGSADYDGYLMVQRDSIQIHFFEFKDLDPKENYGQVYIRTLNIDE